MQILPVKFQENKEKYSTFFIPLITIELKTATLRYAVCDQDITFDGNYYTAFPVEIGVVKSSVDSKRDNTELSLSNVDDAFGLYLFSGGDPRGSIVSIVDISYPESITDPTEFRYRFVGELDSPSLDDSKSIFKCTVKSRMPNYQTGRTLMLSCNNEFADQVFCMASKDLTTGSVQSGSTQSIINTGVTKADNYWKNGHITINGEKQKIKSSSGTQVITEYPFLFNLDVGDSLTLERHCDKSFATCKDIFTQGQNFSGFPSIPFELVVKT